jgi:hypothetical protein
MHVCRAGERHAVSTILQDSARLHARRPQAPPVTHLDATTVPAIASCGAHPGTPHQKPFGMRRVSRYNRAAALCGNCLCRQPTMSCARPLTTSTKAMHRSGREISAQR